MTFLDTHKFGYNPDIDKDDEADIWYGGGIYDGWIDTAQAVDIVSSSDDDTALGTGARTIRLFGLDENFNFQDVVTILDGVGVFSLPETWIRVYRAHVDEVGSVGVNVGTITISASTSGEVLAVIGPLEGQTMQAIFTTHFNYTHVLVQWDATFAGKKNGEAALRLCIREFGKSVRVQDRWHISGGNAPVRKPAAPILIAPKTDVWISATPDDNNSAISASFDIESSSDPIRSI